MKLVIFEGSVTSQLFVPCLTCDLIPFANVNSFTLGAIRQTWDAQNKDLNKYTVFMVQPVHGKCALLQDGLANLLNFHFCPVATIAARHNLTLLHYKLPMKIRGRKSFRLALGLTPHYDTDLESVLYQVDFRTMSFVTITNPPSHASGVSTFISPFDLHIWCCLSFSVVSVAGFFTFLGFHERISGPCTSNITKGELGVPWRFCASLMVRKVITVAFIFLGEVGESSGRSYRNRKVAIILIILWLFGNLFLVVNYYQGSIYSCLAVLLAPQVPRGVEELINLDIPMVDMHTYTLTNGSTQLYLKDIIIPQLLHSPGQSSKFTTFLAKFQTKLLSSNDHHVLQMYAKIARENSTQTHPMLVIFIFRDQMETYVRAVKYLGNRHIVRNTGDTPFRATGFSVGDKSLFSPYLLKGLIRLEGSGLTQRWNKLGHYPEVLKLKNQWLSLGKYFKVVQELFGNVREPVTFHESNAVSLRLILPAFSICGVIIVFGTVALRLKPWNLLIGLRLV